MRIVTPYDHITEKVIRAAYSVHDILSWRYAEKVYENAICVEFDQLGLRYVRQKRTEVFYKDHLVGEFIIDLIVEDAVLVELKAVKEITDEHKAQCINYLTCMRLPLGLVINFGKQLSFQRFLSQHYFPPRPA